MGEWWESVPVHQRGVEIAKDQREGTGRYRLLVPLPCQKCERDRREARTILAQYAGPGGAKWLWTPGYKGLVKRTGPAHESAGPVRTERIPPRAWPYEAGLFRIAVCENCKHGQPFAVTADGINLNFEPAPATFGRVAEG